MPQKCETAPTWRSGNATAELAELAEKAFFSALCVFCGCFWAAALWAVHPLSTEAVTNIVGRADLLAAFGGLAGFLSYLHARESAGSRRLA
ncbi:MAG: hypothetical protein AUJ01_16030 [Acidobacteria bacterium 13_1_40CM_3_65_5]|nr:MAG: hypothetical protein AUJ01_16030 [Acidobacteria bacterium 13_1_40CM_3_65_5]